MLKIAVPNKGSLADAAALMLREAGYRGRRDAHDLVVADPENGVELFFLRPRDIAVYVGEGTLDVGMTGRDLMLDSRAAVAEAMPLGFARSTFWFAAPPGAFSAVGDLAGHRVATAYPNLVADHLAGHGVDAHVVRLDGAIESAVRLGVADAIADVVSTGVTLRQAGLEPFGDEILRSEAVLIRRLDAPEPPDAEEVVFLRRLEGVLVARQYVMVDYDVPAEAVDAACAVTPGIESPTVAPLQRPGWFAVRALVPQAQAHLVMDELYDLGARGILVTSLHACRL